MTDLQVKPEELRVSAPVEDSVNDQALHDRGNQADSAFLFLKGIETRLDVGRVVEARGKPLVPPRRPRFRRTSPP